MVRIKLPDSIFNLDAFLGCILMVNYVCLSNITTSSFVLLVILLGRMELRRSTVEVDVVVQVHFC